MLSGTRLWNREESRCFRRLRSNAVRSGHLQLEDGTKAGWRTTFSRPLISRFAARPAGCGGKPAKARIESRAEAMLHSSLSRGSTKPLDDRQLFPAPGTSPQPAMPDSFYCSYRQASRRGPGRALLLYLGVFGLGQVFRSPSSLRFRPRPPSCPNLEA